MKERPIIFSGPMVRAILEGRKTQTRRVIKLPKWSTERWSDVEIDSCTILDPYHDLPSAICCDTGCLADIQCPYGLAGDRLWVREAWHCDADLKEARAAHEDLMIDVPVIFYRASEPEEAGWQWRSPLHMPRWASRLLLEVIEVRVQRLQEMTQQDALAEAGGVLPSFTYAWDQLNAKRGYPWGSNPWVWALTFRRLENAKEARP